MIDGRKLLFRWAKCGETCSDYVKQIQDFNARLNAVRDISGIAYDGMPHGTDVSQPTERKALSAIDMAAEFGAQVEYLTARVIDDLEVWRLVDGVLNDLPPRYREVATLRYSGGLSWLQISRTLFRSETNCRDMDATLAEAVQRAYSEAKN